MDAIIAFADIQRYVDTPVKQYSSGMEMRLAFAVAAHLDSEIMILDEVLAVGDAAFQKKCLNKIKALAGSGRTILFVSHTMDSIAQFCDSVLLLERGSVSYRGEVSAGIGHYLKGVVTDTAQPLIAQAGSQSRPGSGAVRITSVRPLKAAFMCNETKILEYNIKQLKPLSNKFFIACYLRDSHGVTIVNCDSRQYGHWIAVTDQHTGHFILRTPWLQPGDYSVTMFLGTDEMLDYYDNACILRVSPQPSDLIPSHDLKLSGDLTTLDLKAMAEGVVLAEFSYATLTI
ncbi:MAG: ABC transporter ATP-binding protein [Abitibacteriaceae bacterium]|nr:ABC transporter ATP-binding protein [Abditibacteriaceae bacterium]